MADNIPLLDGDNGLANRPTRTDPRRSAQKSAPAGNYDRKGCRETQGLSSEKMREPLAAVCDLLDVSSKGAILLRHTNNAVFRLVDKPIVVRIQSAERLPERPAKVVAIADWFATHNMPTVRLYPDIPQPVHIDRFIATVWHAIPEADQGKSREPDGHDLGRILHTLHKLTTPPFDLEKWDRISIVRKRVNAAGSELTRAQKHFLHQRCDEIQDQLNHIKWVLPQGVVHGDAHVKNIITDEPGRPVICDFDSTCWGPHEWDLAVVAAGALLLTQRRRETYDQFVATYGVDVTELPSFPMLYELRKIGLLTSMLPLRDSNSEVQENFKHRRDTYFGLKEDAKWEPFR